jgi:hypothetical protein
MSDSTNQPVWASSDAKNWQQYALPLLDQGYFSLAFLNGKKIPLRVVL